VSHQDNSNPSQRRLAEDVFASLPEAVAVVRGDRLLYANPAFTRLFGYTAEELKDASLREMIVPEARRQESVQVVEDVELQGRASLETVRRNKSGELLDVALEAAPLLVNGERGEGGEREGFVLCYRSIGERKRMEAKLQHDALHDALTGLPNRALFLDRLGLTFTRRLRRQDQNCGVLFLDLDHFKEVNDTLGHAAGDVLLKAVAERLLGVLRPQDTAARLGGDEFAVLVDNTLSISDMEIVAGRVLREMEREFDVDGRTIHVGASIGAALAAPEHAAPEMLVRDADFAMYRAKQQGGGRFEIFDKQLKVQVASLRERERELRQALDQRQFEVWYQPIRRLQSGKLEGFESMLCWRGADGVAASFNELLAIAEETGLSISLGRETVEEVARQLRVWREMPGLTLSVNLTQRQFYHPDLLAQVRRTLAASGADPERLLFEVGEAALCENPETAAVIFARLLECDVRLAVDDFGSGLAPLNHLVRLPIDVLKLDPKLTKTAVQTGRQSAVLESLVHLGQKLGVQVVAQGIETPEQLEALTRIGCELGQGPLFLSSLEPGEAQRLAERD
jgi:diguanylate cyclase (GGDEF)-like protein/PAS domain S-box-containing protein